MGTLVLARGQPLVVVDAACGDRRPNAAAIWLCWQPLGSARADTSEEITMAIKQFELFHGAVLTKLLRSDRPVTLRMIETRPGEAWAVYTINDEVDLFVKYSITARKLTRRQGALSWTFVFSPEQISQIRKLQAERDVYAALVCGRKDIKTGGLQTCLLRPDELEHLLDFNDASQQSLTVRYVPRKKLRVYSGHRVELLVAQNALDEWDVPGD